CGERVGSATRQSHIRPRGRAMTLTIANESRSGLADLQLVPLPVDYLTYRRQVIFHGFKWDPQVGDTATISDHACVLSPGLASRLARLAEALASETMNLENALALRPELFADVGIPRRLRPVLRQGKAKAHEGHVRVMRFDFHPTYDGWALSEVNSDVPGGFA